MEPPRLFADVCSESVFLVPNGKVSCSDGNFDGSTCTASCNVGYVMRGSSKRKCSNSEAGSSSSSGGGWLPEEPFKCMREYRIFME